MSKVVASPDSGIAFPQDQADELNLILHGGGEKVEVQWDPEAKVTPNGSLVFFAQFLKTGGLFEQLCEGSPIQYRSNNAPLVRDVWGTVLLAILNGQTRYAHINRLRCDRVAAELLGMKRITCEDSVRNAFKKGTEQEWNEWLIKQERSVYETLLTEKYILDIDNTVKPLYGHQEGAEVSYNPKKPGRPSHNNHTYFIGALRIVLGVDVLPGKKHASSHGAPVLWQLIDSLPPSSRPWLIRGDCGYGTDNMMIEAEKRLLRFLMKLKQTANVRAQIRKLESQSGAWTDAGEGWQGTECMIQLKGWSQARRCIVLRRPAQKGSETKELPPSAPSSEFTFMEKIKGKPDYEYSVLVTNLDLPVSSFGQLYRDRADCENVFDEIKNQWGWCGFVTRDLKRCRIMARIIALVYNWWNIFARLANPEQHMEAATSRPRLLHAIGRLVFTGRKKIIHLTSMHAESEQLQRILTQIGGFLNQLNRTAEQLSAEARWAYILSAAFIKWLKGKVLHPMSDGHQLLMPAL